MTALQNKIDFMVIFTAKNANPNGDPLDGNRPRTDYRGYGEVSDVCIKRKVRNRLLDMGQSIFVQSDDKKNDDCSSLKARYEKVFKNDKNADKTTIYNKACKEWYDVRAFGQVFPFKGTNKKSTKDGESADAVSIGVRGPVSIQSAYSVDSVNISTIQITKSVNLEDESGGKKGSDTIGSKHRVDFGLYTTFGSVNVQLAEKNGFSREDAELLKEALRTMFVNDESAARPSGSMDVVKLIWWEHNSKIGQYSPAKVQSSVKITRKAEINDPKSANDYDIKIEQLEGLEFREFNG